ncbi:MAG: hypothetical protein Q4D19_12070 [Lautropia sp.]|nr:hypothetical protein [Lautropia sp.]
MSRFSAASRVALSLLLVSVLAACGGGGVGGGDPVAAAAAGVAANAAVGTAVDQAADQATDVLTGDSRWSVNNYTYANRTRSAQQYVDGSPGYTVVSVSALPAGGGADTVPVAWRGSNLAIKFVGKDTGTYQVAGNDDAFTAALGSGIKAIRIQVTVGTSSQSGQSRYDVASGQVRISRDASGRFHLSSSGNLTAVRSGLALNGGLPDAPAQLSFSMQNVH